MKPPDEARQRQHYKAERGKQVGKPLFVLYSLNTPILALKYGGCCRFWLPFGYPTKEKRLILNELSAVFSTQSRDRTGMEVNPLVFETSASTNSAIWA